MNRADLLGLAPEQLTPEAVRRLGQVLGGLAPWWLRPEILERLEEERGWPFPRNLPLPRSHGSCWIMMVQRDDQPWPTVREAFFLPLHWQKGRGWDDRLPGQLLDLAKEVTVELELTDYGLSLHPVIQPEPPTIPSPPGGFDFGSGAISLAGGLYLAAKNGEPDPAIGASACWKKAEGVLGVDREGLKKKLQLAAAWEMKAFFVAKEQLPDAQACPGDVEILGLPQGRSKLERAIQEFVVHQKAEPSAPTSLNDQEGIRRNLEHWEFLPAEHKKSFYDKQLLPWVLARFTALTLQEADAAQVRNLQALVTIVTGQKDTTLLAARALSRLGVRHCLLLYSRDQNGEQEKMATALSLELEKVLGKGPKSAGEQWPVITCCLHPFDPKEHMPGELAEGIRTFCKQFPAEHLILDITGGKSLMKWVADHTMPAGSWRFCMENDEYIGNRPKPLTEHPHLWRESKYS